MDLSEPIHDTPLVPPWLGIPLGGLGVVLLTNPIHSAFPLGPVLVRRFLQGNNMVFFVGPGIRVRVFHIGINRISFEQLNASLKE